MPEVTRHKVSELRITHALDDIYRRTSVHWRELYYYVSLKRLQEMGGELLDHAAASTLQDPALGSPLSRTVLSTAAECALGVLSVGAFPKGDFEIPLPLVGETLSSADPGCAPAAELVPTARTWLDAFTLCVISGAIGEAKRGIGLVLRNDYAPAIHDGVPYSPLESRSGPADLVEMDVLCGYLTRASSHLPSGWPTTTLCMPTADERGEAARRLDALVALSPDQRLLRVLLQDDQREFERALVDRLIEYRESRPADAAPRSLLPIGAIALAALAVHVHGWELNTRSGYLPEGLLRASQGAPGAGA
ncbi:immunity 49 family protein [Streptomyces rishiriensis]|uniref:Immunity protein 49 of polymorphic toxin system n=1 Tax=Streptomyces rishiriensis TaxID=68264 RepID=A0ABU0P236_STRRH|nr:immunity 49 family protein [Streptomyces rishiriensis]MDQ0585455.1 hypothetical protein [Streptomyces rishiriensis]